MKALILDDEPYCTEALQVLINRHCKSITATVSFTEPNQAISYLESHPIDILFLDIEMPLISGFEFLEKARNFRGAVIFTTAYENYALKAFQADAIDYLLKPIDKSELIKAVEKVNRLKPTLDQSQFLEFVKSTLDKNQANDRKVPLSTADGIHMIDPEKIIRCESDGSYSHIYIQQAKPMLVSKNLKELEDLFHSKRFYRVHKSHLINLDHIKFISRQDGGYVVMSDDSSVAISRGIKEEFFNLIKGS